MGAEGRLDGSNIEVREVHDVPTCRAIERLQVEVWGSVEDMVPYHQLYVAARHGGLLLAALDGAEVVGFSYGFPARHGGEWVLHSHMTAVREGYRDRGVGRLLKQAQRERARALGYPRITWTFDPLESRNAYFNLNRLGAFARTYYEDYYGAMEDALNRGLPSDRLLAEWPTAPPAGPGPAETPPSGAAARWPSPSPPEAPLAFGVDERGGWPAPGAPVLPPPDEAAAGAAATAAAEVVRVAIPARIQDLKAADRDLALAWRLAVREHLGGYLKAGYVAVDVQRPADPARGWGAYVLRRTVPTG